MGKIKCVLRAKKKTKQNKKKQKKKNKTYRKNYISEGFCLCSKTTVRARGVRLKSWSKLCSFPSAFNAVFTNLNASGRYGPASLGSHYTGQGHDGQVRLSSGIQQWTVPYTGDYRIEAIGAAGGYDKESNSTQYRGRGARMIGTFRLYKSEVIEILVGQEGGINSNFFSSGGGGGTFVVRGNNTPVIIAGGGGGIESASSRHAGCDASTNTTGNPGYRSWSGGSNGHGAQTADGYSGKSILWWSLTLDWYQLLEETYLTGPTCKGG